MTNYASIKGFLAGLRPEPIYTVSEWADAHRMLSPVASAEHGRWRTSRTPYLREIMDKLSAHDSTQEIVFIKGAQIGATEAGNCWVGYVMDAAPGPMLMVMPTDDTIKRNSKIRIDPMIEATPRLREKVAAKRSRDSSNTMYQKEFPGGVLIMTGGNSAAGLRSMPVRYLFLDEVDAYPYDLDGEGSPIDLAKKRTATYSKRKIFIVSTPTVEGSSAIESAYLATDQRKYQVPCLECDHMQEIKFKNLKWDEGKPDSAMLACEGCGVLIPERNKPTMLARGEWIVTAAENTSHRRVGFHLNSLYSPLGWYSWADAANDWIAAQKDVNKMKTFVNTVLGETWRDKGEAPEWQRLYDKRESYEQNAPPKEVCFITAGADIQKDRIEVEIVGWGKGKQSWSLDYRVIMGDTATAAPYDTLRQIITEQWKREDGMILPMQMMAVDSGYNTQHVYQFCQRMPPDRVIPIKGQEAQSVIIQAPKQVMIARNGKRIGHVKVWHVGVSIIKSELYGWLRQDKDEDGTTPQGYCHFPQYGQVFFRGLTAERLEFRVVRGYRRYQWVKHYERNEPLDCRVYARAAASVVGIDAMEDQHYDAMVVRGQGQPAKKKPRSSDGSFWG